METQKENKYYTPSIEEFIREFEYEEKINNEWVNKINPNSEEFYNIIINLKQNPENFRVKSLDKKDIEELLWKLDSNKSDYSHPNTNLKMQINSNNKIRFYIPGKSLGSFSNELELEIKNKYALKSIMKQLNII
jgi:hypothetical protein